MAHWFREGFEKYSDVRDVKQDDSWLSLAPRPISEWKPESGVYIVEVKPDGTMGLVARVADYEGRSEFGPYVHAPGVLQC